MYEIMIINVVIVIVMLLFLYSGYKQGFLWKLISILGFFVVGWLAWMASDPVSSILALYPKDQIPLQGTIVEGVFYDSMNRLLLFAILFAVFEVILLLLKPIAKLADMIPVVSTLNRWCGLVLGGVQGILLVSVCALFLTFPFVHEGKRYVQESVLQYCQPVCTAIWKLVEKPLLQVPVFHEQTESIKPLKEDEKQQLKQWLLDIELDKESVDAILGALR